MSGLVSLGGFPPVEERSRPDGAEEEAPDTNRTSGDDGDDEEVLTKKNNKINFIQILFNFFSSIYLG